MKMACQHHDALLTELRAAHQIIRNGLNVMTTEQKVAWAEANARDGVDGEGITRANERETVIAQAQGRQQGRPASIAAQVDLADVRRAGAVFAELRRTGPVAAWKRRDIEAAVRWGKSPFIAMATTWPVVMGVDYAREGGAA